MAELIKFIILPSHLVAIFLGLGLCFTTLSRFRRTGAYLLVAGAATYVVFSNGIVAAALIGPLEYRYPPLLQIDPSMEAHTLVVLTSYASDDPAMPLSSRPGASAAYRVLETVRLFAAGMATDIVVSGDESSGKIMAELLFVEGVPRSSVELDSGANSTLESARRVGEIVASSNVFLVTSAGHMPRAVNGFRAAGINVIPAPTDHKLPQDATSASMLPSGFHLEVSDMAVHEYVALLWYRISGKTDRYW